jgi:hypothetical protein
MSTPLKKLEALVRELIKKELDEASVTGNLDGGAGPPKTPYAFSGKRKKDKDKEKRIATAGGYMKVKEAKFHVKVDTLGSVLVDASGKGEAKMIVAKKLKGGVKAITSVTRVNTSKAKQVDKKLESVREHTVSFTKDEMEKMHNDGEVVKADPDGKEHTYVYKESVSVNEGHYHNYRNDETLSPKQKIGYSMREVRDKLSELDKLVKMNVRLKNEIGVDSTSYWKNTHNAMKKISERLVKLANKVGQLY